MYCPFGVNIFGVPGSRIQSSYPTLPFLANLHVTNLGASAPAFAPVPSTTTSSERHSSTETLHSTFEGDYTLSMFTLRVLRQRTSLHGLIKIHYPLHCDSNMISGDSNSVLPDRECNEDQNDEQEMDLVGITDSEQTQLLNSHNHVLTILLTANSGPEVEEIFDDEDTNNSSKENLSHNSHYCESTGHKMTLESE